MMAVMCALTVAFRHAELAGDLLVQQALGDHRQRTRNCCGVSSAMRCGHAGLVGLQLAAPVASCGGNHTSPSSTVRMAATMLSTALDLGI